MQEFVSSSSKGRVITTRQNFWKGVLSRPLRPDNIENVGVFPASILFSKIATTTFVLPLDRRVSI